MESGVGNTDDEIQRTEQQLRDAREGRTESRAERQQVFANAAVLFLQNMVSAAKVARASLGALHALSPAASAVRLTLYQHLDKIERVDQALTVTDSLVAGYDYGELIRTSRANLQQFMIALQDSGLSDEGVALLSNAVLPGIGPLVVAHAALARDYIFAEMQVDFAESHARDLESVLTDLRNARRSHGFTLEQLRKEHVACSLPSDRDAGRPADSSLTPPLPEPEPPVEAKKGSSAMMAIGAVGAAVGVGLLAGSLVPVEGVDDTDSGGSAGGITLVSGSFNCRYNAGGIVSSCSESVVTINVTMRLPVGSRLKLATNHIQSTGTVPTTRDPAGNVTFRGFSGGGWFDQCGPPVTRLVLINTSVSSNGIAQITGISMPVTCRD